MGRQCGKVRAIDAPMQSRDVTQSERDKELPEPYQCLAIMGYYAYLNEVGYL